MATSPLQRLQNTCGTPCCTRQISSYRNCLVGIALAILLVKRLAYALRPLVWQASIGRGWQCVLRGFGRQCVLRGCGSAFCEGLGGNAFCEAVAMRSARVWAAMRSARLWQCVLRGVGRRSPATFAVAKQSQAKLALSIARCSLVHPKAYAG